MSSGYLQINKTSLINNLKKLQRLSNAETGAVVKADAYGLGAHNITKILAQNGVKTYFVAMVDEAKIIREALGDSPKIYVFSGLLEADTKKFINYNARPILNSLDQVAFHKLNSKSLPFAIQIETGINRLGITAKDWSNDLAIGADFVMSHLACADEPGNTENQDQLNKFINMTSEIKTPKSLSATAGILLGRNYHFDLTRPGIGLYGGFPFTDSDQVISVDLPIIQTKLVRKGETIGYGATHTFLKDTIVATVSAGYADGIFRRLTDNLVLYDGNIPCKCVGRISMDLITVDISHLDKTPNTLSFIGPHQSIDQVATLANTIGHEVLTSIGTRYNRVYK